MDKSGFKKKSLKQKNDLYNFVILEKETYFLTMEMKLSLSYLHICFSVQGVGKHELVKDSKVYVNTTTLTYAHLKKTAGDCVPYLLRRLVFLAIIFFFTKILTITLKLVWTFLHKIDKMFLVIVFPLFYSFSHPFQYFRLFSRDRLALGCLKEEKPDSKRVKTDGLRPLPANILDAIRGKYNICHGIHSIHLSIRSCVVG